MSTPDMPLQRIQDGLRQVVINLTVGSAMTTVFQGEVDHAREILRRLPTDRLPAVWSAAQHFATLVLELEEEAAARELAEQAAAEQHRITVAEGLAERFHEAYERLAPAHGYETREASAKPWAEVPDDNKRLMVAVVQELLDQGVIDAKTED